MDISKFTPEATQDNRGDFERLLPEGWDIAMEQHAQHTPQGKRIQIIMDTFQVSPVQAALVDGSYKAASRQLMEVFGRCIDEVDDNEGLRSVAFKVVLDGLQNALEHLAMANNAMVMEYLMTDDIRPTEGCDCNGCKLARILGRSLKRRDAAYKRRQP